MIDSYNLTKVIIVRLSREGYILVVLENTRQRRQVTSLLFQSDVIISCRISAYSGTYRNLFKHEHAVFNGEQEKETVSRVRVG